MKSVLARKGLRPRNVPVKIGVYDENYVKVRFLIKVSSPEPKWVFEMEKLAGLKFKNDS